MENKDQSSRQEPNNASDQAVAFCDKLNEELKPLRVEISILTTDIDELN
jgi:hypothetical protein